MPTLATYHLDFHSGFHLGAHGVNLEEHSVHIPADSLFAALVSMWRRTGGEVTPFAQPFCGETPNPPFLLTSAFPFVGDVRFYPLPVDLTRLFGVEVIRKRGKAIKRLRFLSEELLEKALRGESLDDDLFPLKEEVEPESGVALQGGTLWLTMAEIEKLPATLAVKKHHVRALRQRQVWSSHRVPRVTIQRTNNAATIFHIGRTSFAKDCGLWFGVEWRQPDLRIVESKGSYQAALGRLLAQLSDEGVGGERTSGYGACTVRRGGDVQLADAQAGAPLWLLSRYHPRATELPQALAHNDAAYALAEVGGWLLSPDGAAQRRRSIQLVKEGSIVCPPAHPAGNVADVRPNYRDPAGDLPHPVYRYGLALGVGLPGGRGADHG